MDKGILLQLVKITNIITSKVTSTLFHRTDMWPNKFYVIMLIKYVPCRSSFRGLPSRGLYYQCDVYCRKPLSQWERSFHLKAALPLAKGFFYRPCLSGRCSNSEDWRVRSSFGPPFHCVVHICYFLAQIKTNNNGIELQKYILYPLKMHTHTCTQLMYTMETLYCFRNLKTQFTFGLYTYIYRLYNPDSRSKLHSTCQRLFPINQP